ncbi:hypothetical protein Tco_1205501 [Tanacetum coccineum]
MANEHVPSPATTRSDDQILLFNAWVPIGKGNHEFLTVAAAGKRHVNLQPHAHTIFLIKDIMISERPITQLPQLLCVLS